MFLIEIKLHDFAFITFLPLIMVERLVLSFKLSPRQNLPIYTKDTVSLLQKINKLRKRKKMR